ncbi:MAG TPA: SapC family protein [Roseomonas sp.]|jgi:hypothetical protein
MDAPASPAQWPGVPPFYRQPAVLDGDRHRNHGLLPDARYGFAAESTAIVIGVGEFMPALRHYPIVFTDAADPMPVAVTGLTRGRNLFVSSEGTWRPQHYVPGYLRRYPFILSPSADGETATLLVDEACPRFVDSSRHRHATRLFDDAGDAAAAAQEVMAFCHTAHQEQQRTVAFARALREAGLLAPRNVQIRTPGGGQHAVDGFQLVEEEKFRALRGPILEAWQARGWLDAIALHLVSQQNWLPLGELQDQRRGR